MNNPTDSNPPTEQSDAHPPTDQVEAEDIADVDFDVDEAEEEAHIAAIERRNRRRVLIPLGLLVALWLLLSLFGDPIPPSNPPAKTGTSQGP